MSKLLTVSMVTQQYPISRWSLYRWVKAGTIPYTKIGGRLFFRQDALENWLLSLEVTPRELAPAGAPLAAAGR